MQYSFDGEYCWNGSGVTWIDTGKKCSARECIFPILVKVCKICKKGHLSTDQVFRCHSTFDFFSMPFKNLNISYQTLYNYLNTGLAHNLDPHCISRVECTYFGCAWTMTSWLCPHWPKLLWPQENTLPHSSCNKLTNYELKPRANSKKL